jgi:uncharacterized protein (DUF1684 family)
MTSRFPAGGLFAAAVAVAVALVLTLPGGCARYETARGPAPPATPESAQAASVAMWHSRYDQGVAQWNALLVSDDSPLPEEKRAHFAGQPFFPFAPAWRFVGDLVRLHPMEAILVPDTKGKTQVYYDYGRYPLRVGESIDTLRVYRPSDHPEQYFIAFRDSTTGSETYGGGRYAHLDSLDEHRFVLDFNLAYNPYCAYDTTWMCPLPPRENTLPFAVRAGMTKPPGGHE